jgi:hypothetical protein
MGCLALAWEARVSRIPTGFYFKEDGIIIAAAEDTA